MKPKRDRLRDRVPWTQQITLCLSDVFISLNSERFTTCRSADVDAYQRAEGSSSIPAGGRVWQCVCVCLCVCVCVTYCKRTAACVCVCVVYLCLCVEQREGGRGNVSEGNWADGRQQHVWNKTVNMKHSETDLQMSPAKVQNISFEILYIYYIWSISLGLFLLVELLKTLWDQDRTKSCKWTLN